jgi:hypothetical protein
MFKRSCHGPYLEPDEPNGFSHLIVGYVGTNVSEEPGASVFRIENGCTRFVQNIGI